MLFLTNCKWISNGTIVYDMHVQTGLNEIFPIQHVGVLLFRGKNLGKTRNFFLTTIPTRTMEQTEFKVMGILL